MHVWRLHDNKWLWLSKNIIFPPAKLYNLRENDFFCFVLVLRYGFAGFLYIV